MREWRYKREDGKIIWKELEKVMNYGSRDVVFEDWLDIIIYSNLALTEAKTESKSLEELKDRFVKNKLSETYDKKYLDIIGKYKDDKNTGERKVDAFSRAYGFLVNETIEKQKDILGDIYMEMITFGQHGQFFTPEHITEMMTKMTFSSKSEKGTEVVCDPCCGSGRFLLSAYKENPNNFLVGMDLDPRCAKMAVVNFMIREMTGDIYWGNSLSGKMNKVYMIRNGWLKEEDLPETPESMKPLVEKQLQLL